MNDMDSRRIRTSLLLFLVAKGTSCMQNLKINVHVEWLIYCVVGRLSIRWPLKHDLLAAPYNANRVPPELSSIPHATASLWVRNSTFRWSRRALEILDHGSAHENPSVKCKREGSAGWESQQLRENNMYLPRSSASSCHRCK